MSEVTPILVVGSARSGTTSLVNELASYSNVLCASDELHYGSIESNFASHYKYWGDLSNKDRYIEMLAYLSVDDYFLSLGGVDLDYFLDRNYSCFFEFFFEYMDLKSQAAGKDFWVTKFDPLLLLNQQATNRFWEKFNERYNDYKIYLIKRDLTSVLVSYLSMEGIYYNIRTKPLVKNVAVFLQALRWHLLYKEFDGFLGESLNRIDFKAYIRCGLSLDENVFGRKHEIFHAVNTSFSASSQTKKLKLSVLDRFLVSVSAAAVRVKISKILLNILWGSRVRSFSYHRILLNRHFPFYLREELKSVGASVAESVSRN